MREDVLGRDSFRTGLQYFERTLELLHRLSRCDLDHVPLAFLKNTTDDAANTVDQFRNILKLKSKDLEHSCEARDLLVNDVGSFERIGRDRIEEHAWPNTHAKMPGRNRELQSSNLRTMLAAHANAPLPAG